MSTDDLFFTILRSSLWSEAPNVNGLVDPDWKAVFAMAREQTVDGLMADGIASLNKSDSPVGIPPEYVRSLMIQTIGIGRANAGPEQDTGRDRGPAQRERHRVLPCQGTRCRKKLPSPRAQISRGHRLSS